MSSSRPMIIGVGLPVGRWEPGRVFAAAAVFLIAIAADGQVVERTPRPIALQMLEDARKQTHSGRVDWTVLPAGDETRAITYVSRYAASGDMIFENRGDPEGFVSYDEQGKGNHRFPQIYMVNSEGTWYCQETGVGAQFWRRDGQPSPWDGFIHDIRGAGMWPTNETMHYSKGFAPMWGTREDPLIQWEEEQRDGLHIVTGRSENGASVTWYIDPQRGWNAERVVAEIPGQRWESISLLTEFDGVWLPEQTYYYSNGKLYEAVAVHSARFDQPGDQRRFTVLDIGFEPGINIFPRNFTVNGTMLIWNGEAAVSIMEWANDLKEGVRKRGPRIQAWVEHGLDDNPYLTDEQRAMNEVRNRKELFHARAKGHDALWVKYVRDFIARFELNTGQTETAWRIHKQCVQQADQHIQRNRSRFEELVNKLYDARKAENNEQVEDLTRRLDKLRAPIDRIFEERLKPGLDKLPTRAQRAAAEKKASPTTAPAKP